MLTASWFATLVITVNAAVAATQASPPAPTAPAPPPDRPIAGLLQNLGEDFKRLPALDTLVILGSGGVAAAVSSNSDDRVNRWTLENPSPSWTKIGRIGADGWTMGAAAVTTWMIGRAADRPLVAHVGSDLIRAQVLNAVITRTTKIVVNRRRPSGGGHAFPSGHASAAFASAGVLQQHFGWKGAIPAYAVAGFFAMTRVRDRSHSVSDAVFGAAVGLAAARAVTRGHDSRAWTVAPVVVRGGGGVMVTRR